jgi:hypothetical protein
MKSRLLIATGCIACLVVASVILIKPTTDRYPTTDILVAAEADRLAEFMYDAYCGGTFEEAKHAVGQYIAYVESNKARLKVRRNVPAMLSGAHSMAGYMYLHTFEDELAYHHLKLAFDYHTEHHMLKDQEAVPKEEFIDFVLSVRSMNESRLEVAWKRDARMEATTLMAARVRFDKP